MRRIIALLKNRLFISVLGIISLTILIWFVGPLVAIAEVTPLEGVVARLIAIIVCLAIWSLNNVIQQQKVKKANIDFSQNFKQVNPTQDQGPTAEDEELGTIQSKFGDAVKLLQKSTRAKGRVNLYELPWYIIIGPPGSGKTTALVNSGLKFPLADLYGKTPIKGEGGTRNCDWWFTEEAVLIDTAGRYTSQDSHSEIDSAGWRGFLDLLKKHRKRRPLNGALVAISIEDLITLSDHERNRQIDAIKSRLNELNQKLQVRFPVYVVFTKCDLIAGFTEYFEDLGAEERRQVWGMSFPFSAKVGAGESVSYFAEEFDALMERLSNCLFGRIQSERDPDRCTRIFSFPQQISSLKPVIEKYLEDIFGSSRFSEQCLLRGCYFTSGTQEGTPIDRIMGSLSRSLGIGQDVVMPRTGEGRSYFMSYLLKKIVFEESELVGVNQKFEIQRRVLQSVAYGMAGLVTLLAIVGWTTSFARNQNYVYKAKDALDNYRYVLAQNEQVESIEQLIARLNAASALTKVYEPFKKEVPFLMGLGLYQGDKMTSAGSEVYKYELEQLLVPAIQYRIEDRLVSSEDTDFRYETLKTYLTLAKSSPKSEDEKTLIKQWARYDWQSAFPDDAETQGRVQNHVEAMLEMGYAQPEINSQLVSDIRADLGAIRRSELLYGLMKRDYLAADTDPLRSVDLLGPKGRRIFEDRTGSRLNDSISSFYTYDGYHEKFKKQVKDVSRLAEKESWVLSDSGKKLTKPEIEAIQKEIEDLYFSDYVNSWESLLSGIKLTNFASVQELADALLILSSTDSPILRGLNEITRNTQLTSGGSSALAGGNKKAAKINKKVSRVARLFKSTQQTFKATVSPEAINPVEERFQPIHNLVIQDEDGSAPVDHVMERLSQLHAQYEAMAIGVGNDLLDVAKGAGSSDLITRIQSESTRQPKPLKGWMYQLSHAGRGVVYSSAKSDINNIWVSDVYPLCSQAVNGRYPFSKHSARDITLMDFGKLFGPGGLIDSFFQEHIKPFVKVSGGKWIWREKAGLTIGVSNTALEKFRLAAVIKDTYFQQGGLMPSISFTVKPRYLDANVRSVNFDFEGQSVRYRHGPARLHPVVWPYISNGSRTGHVSLAMFDDSSETIVLNKEGPWALFRLLDSAETEKRTRDISDASFNIKGRTTTWELRASTVNNPFSLKELNNFSCVKSL